MVKFQVVVVFFIFIFWTVSELFPKVSGYNKPIVEQKMEIKKLKGTGESIVCRLWSGGYRTEMERKWYNKIWKYYRRAH